MLNLIKGSYQFAASSDIGAVYKVNQDAYSFDKIAKCFVVADGVGGHQQGEIASQQTVAKLQIAQRELAKESKLTKTIVEQRLVTAINEINKELIAIGNQQQISIGTTVVSALILDEYLHYAHVGDTRLYVLRNGILRALTKDDTLKQQMLDEAIVDETIVKQNVPGNIVTQAIGITADLDVHYGHFLLRSGDLVLCSTDGLHDVFTHLELENYLREANLQLANEANLLALAERLISLALARGSKDNISVLLVKRSRSVYFRIKEKFLK